MRQQIRDEFASIVAFDAREQADLALALAWIDSGAELCRLAKPATPPIHLVSYFMVLDGPLLLLVDHRNAQLWLPPGGHVEPGEHPRATVARELQEELGFAAPHPVAAPVFVTATRTVGLGDGHLDISLWYVIHARRSQAIVFDQREFSAVRWFGAGDVPWARAEPHLRRLLAKLGQAG
jgi:8-oxo-dGTP diphosphatase